MIHCSGTWFVTCLLHRLRRTINISGHWIESSAAFRARQADCDDRKFRSWRGNGILHLHNNHNHQSGFHGVAEHGSYSSGRLARNLASTSTLSLVLHNMHFSLSSKMYYSHDPSLFLCKSFRARFGEMRNATSGLPHSSCCRGGVGSAGFKTQIRCPT